MPIEVRIYAEDPARDFAPSIGRLTAFRMPAEQDGVRVDTGFAAGDTVSVHYDAMLAKLICHGPPATTRCASCARALAECLIAASTATSICWTASRRIRSSWPAASTPALSGATPIRCWRRARAHADRGARRRRAVVLDGEAADAKAAAAVSADPYSPWHARDQWWLNASAARVLGFVADDAAAPVTARREAGGWRVNGILGSAQPAAGRSLRRLSLDGMPQPCAGGARRRGADPASERRNLAPAAARSGRRRGRGSRRRQPPARADPRPGHRRCMRSPATRSRAARCWWCWRR